MMGFFQKKEQPQKVSPPEPPHIECRGIWAALPQVPKWLSESTCALFREIPPGDIRPFLQWIIEAAFAQSEALVWLPVVLVGGMVRSKMEYAWQWGIKTGGIDHHPPQPDFREFAGPGSVTNSVMALLKEEPAVLVVSAGDAGAVAILFTRSGLTVPEGGVPADGQVDPYTPYWERNIVSSADWEQWGNIPPSLAPEFLLNFLPIATLYETAFAEGSGKSLALARQALDALRYALTHAGLSSPPENPPDIGQIVHDSESVVPVAALLSALQDCGCQLDPINDTCNVREACGEEIRSVLLLAGGLVCAEQRGKAVLIAEIGEGMNIGLVINE